MRALPVIIMGAKGRMGATLVNLADNDPGLTLGGLVERSERQEGLECYGCPVVADIQEVLGLPGAVVVDFTAPAVTLDTAAKAAVTATPVVVGTTGLNNKELATLKDLALKTPIFWAPNMSVGINALLRVLPDLVKLLGEDYDLELMEIHHKHKKDAPSGTALKLAECLAHARGRELEEIGTFSRHGIIGERPKGEIGVQTLRGGDVVGDHTVYCLGPGERIEITHRAHSRETFARGALRAAQWLAGQQPGKLYTMADMLG
ncbi:MAG: 4-hydroxy-tetrahydrodipicolinate reductase [Desulfoplanes sp.]